LPAARSWLSALGLSLALAACGPSKPVGLGEVDAAAGDAAPASACVRTSVQLPWPARTASGGHVALEVVAGEDAIAVLNRQPAGLEARLFDFDGAPLAAGTFDADSQVLAAPGGGFGVVTRTDDGREWVHVTFAADLTGGSAAFAVPANDTERALGAVDTGAAPILVTSERFINLATGASAFWVGALGKAAADGFQTGRLYGLTAQTGKVLVAWGTLSTLGLAVVDTAAHVLGNKLDDKFLGYLGAQTAAAMPVPEGLLLFDGNPVRATRIDFALARHELARNEQLKTFYRTAPRVAGLTVGGQPVAFWLTVFPSTDATQGSTTHQLYGCALDLADGKTCAGTALIASPGLGGYGLADEPVAAAALPDGARFAIVHTDAAGGTWLRVADLSCAVARP
jgi:hypothetical protein